MPLQPKARSTPPTYPMPTTMAKSEVETVGPPRLLPQRREHRGSKTGGWCRTRREGRRPACEGIGEGGKGNALRMAGHRDDRNSSSSSSNSSSGGSVNNRRLSRKWTVPIRYA